MVTTTRRPTIKKPAQKQPASTPKKTPEKKQEKEKDPVLRIVTPPGLATYPHLIEPDTFFNEEGRYNCGIRFPKVAEVSEDQEETESFINAVTEFYDLLNVKGDPPIKDGDTFENEIFHDNWVLLPSSKFEVIVVDAVKQEYDASKIWTGDLVRAAVTFKKTITPAKKTYCTAYLTVVQLLEKRAKGAGERALEMLGDWERLAIDEVDDTTAGEYSDDNGDF